MLLKFVKYLLNFRKVYRRKRRIALTKKTLGFDGRGRFSYPVSTVQGKCRYSVVSAVYNVENYLDDFLYSLVRQTLDFKAHIQVVLVDDGSTDRSGEICAEWAERFPENIVCIKKENGGQASARNKGLPYASGEWVTFSDPDDLISDEYFFNVDRALQKESCNLSLVSCNFIPFYEGSFSIKDNHPLKFRFQHGDRFSDFRGSEADMQLNVNSAFFRRDFIAKHGLWFDERITPTFEDSHFVNRYLLLCQPRVLFLASSIYWYRKRVAGNSALDGAMRHKGTYSSVLRYGVLGLFDFSLKEKGAIPGWLQRTVLYHLVWHYRFFVNNEEKAGLVQGRARIEYLKLLNQISEYLDLNYILGLGAIERSERDILGMAHLIKGHTDFASDVRVTGFDAQRMAVRLKFYYAKEPPELTVRQGGKKARPVCFSSRQFRFISQSFITEGLVWVSWNGSGSLSIEVNGAPYKLTMGGSASSALTKDEVRDYFEPSQVNQKDLPVTAKAYRCLAGSGYFRKRFRDAWIFLDRDAQADDNAEHLYRHVRKNSPTVNAWFVLRRDSSDWDRLKEDGFKLLEFGSIQHKIALLNCVRLISSHIDRYVTNYMPRKYYRDIMDYKLVFLQHGVIKDDLSQWLNTKTPDLFVCSAAREFQSIVAPGSPYKFSPHEVKLTGMPRHDALLEKATRSEPKSIVLMPTWRKSLVGDVVGKSNRREMNHEFTSSEFFQAWNSLLQSKALHKLANDTGCRIVFFLHANFQPYLRYFDVVGVETMTHSSFGSIQDIFSDTALLLTDYSSVAFEVAYLHRPVVYYQFDREEVFSGGHIYRPGYFDYKRDGFGPVCETESELEAVLGAISVSGGCPQLEPIYSERVSSFFEFRDGQCCERVFQEILALDESYGEVQ